VTDLSIIIVNFKTPALLLDCLRTVYIGTGGIEFEVIVVDNDSGDDSEQRVRSAYPQVRWIQMGYNAGFSRANNEGIRCSEGTAVLLLNSDTLAKGNAVGDCYRMLVDSIYVACGVQLLNSDGSPQISGNYFMKGGLNYLLPLPFLGGWVKSFAGFFGVARPNVPEASGTVEVDWVNGAFLMVKRSAFLKAGLMDEDFFLYAEEIEWCGRLRKVGQLCIYGQLHVVHLQGMSANETFGSGDRGYHGLFDRKGLQIMLSNFVRIRKQFGVGWFLIQLAFYLLEVPIFGVGALLSGLIPRQRRKYSWAMFRGYCRNLGYVISRSGTIIRNKAYFYKVL
jgi:hypothetical protein